MGRAPWLHVIGLSGLSFLLALLLERYDLAAWFQSPLSPVWPVEHMLAATPDSFPPGPLVSPLSPAMERWADLFDAPWWSSPFLWLAVGLVFFGGLAFGIIQILRHTRSPES